MGDLPATSIDTVMGNQKEVLDGESAISNLGGAGGGSETSPSNEMQDLALNKSRRSLGVGNEFGVPQAISLLELVVWIMQNQGFRRMEMPAAYRDGPYRKLAVLTKWKRSIVSFRRQCQNRQRGNK